ncbi:MULTISPECIES: sugar phosphorylase [Clostridium]|uniref:sugar phosphorylase n=1 Tax=Clostridium TaxID=1485 RepID=UPI000CF5E134|nr:MULTISPECIES: sugar phosphorylase [Clostridium]MBN1045712.1 alpha-amylase [Clostridium botulinum]NFT06629.1 alpha-amylase [Clostridium botulinum]
MNRVEFINSVIDKIKFIYGENYKEEYKEEFDKLVSKWENEEFNKTDEVSEKNVYLITYGDSIYEEGVPAIQTLNKFLKEEVKDTITDVHILPMFTYTSDDGFSVVDYMEIDKNLGNWEDIKTLSKDYRLMYDFVANHISKSSSWFKGYLNNEKKYAEYFIKEDESFDTKNVVRPRTSPLFHEYEGKDGIKTAWTTFSEDQIDVNIKHFPLFIEMTDILLNYAKNGATSIRLDAIGFLWKKSGTSCMHLPETHKIIEIWRLLLNYFKKNTQIITETNVPHVENVSYFGNKNNEAQMVYQFTLPPLVLYTLTTHNSKKLTDWAKTIDRVSENATYFNFLSSHDGIGMRPTEGILTEEEKQVLVDKVVENGGRVSYKNNTDGTKSVYELNINYNDALINKNEDISTETQVDKIIASNAILLSCVGVPAIYYHSLLGSRNDYKGLEESGINRRINREKLEYTKILKELEVDERRSAIFSRIKKLITLRKEESAFSPFAMQKVLELGESIFALERFNEETGEKITLILNIDSKEANVYCNIKGVDKVTGRKIDGNITLKPYEFVWIK